MFGDFRHRTTSLAVRSSWVANVALGPWRPMFEIAHRKVVAFDLLFDELTIEAGYVPIYRRAFAEAGFL